MMTISIKFRALIFKNTLTCHNTTTKINTHCKSSVGFSSSLFRQGDNTPQLLAVFLCLPFLDAPKFWAINSIMTVLRWQPSRLVSHCRDTANQFNAVARFLAVLRDGFTTLRQGITAWNQTSFNSSVNMLKTHNLTTNNFCILCFSWQASLLSFYLVLSLKITTKESLFCRIVKIICL